MTQLDAAASRILTGSASPRLRGKAALSMGHASDAVEALRAAAAKGGPEARSNLAAALVEEAKELDAYDPALDAVIEARTAIALKPDLSAAHFNLALALERLGLTVEARTEFEKAAALEPGTAWSVESRRRADAVRRPIPDWRASIEPKLKTAADPQVQRALIRSNVEYAWRFAEGPYLLDWARATIDGKGEEARKHLDLCRMIGAITAETSNDRLVADTVSVIDRAVIRGRAAELELARAHALYGDGRVAVSKRDITTAIRLLTQGGRELARLGSPLQYSARYYTAAALYEETRVAEAVAIVESLDREHLEAKKYFSLDALLEWVRGVSHLVRGSYAEALHAFDVGYATSIAIGNREQAASFDGLAPEALEYLGESREAWARRARALRALATLDSGNAKLTRTTTLRAAANLQIAARRFARARAILDYTVPLAIHIDDPVSISNALAQRAVARAELRDPGGAASDRAAAARATARLAASALRDRLQIDLDIADGAAKRVTSPQTAVVHFSNAIDLLRSKGQSALLPRLYFERAHAYEAIGDIAHVRQDLRSVLEVVAGWEESIDDFERRAAIGIWSDASRRELIALELGQRDVGAAFAYADARRTAAPQQGAGASQRRLSHIDVQRALAPNAAIVEYVTTSDKLVVFIITRNDLRAVTLPARVSRVAAVAETMRTAEEDSFRAAAGVLYELVIAPIRRRLGGVTTLAVVPDRELTGIPFGALHDGIRDRYLGEDIAVVHDLTANDAILWSRKAQPAREPTMLSIGASVFDRQQYPNAAALAAVDGEAADIAALSPNAHRLLGTNATAVAVERELKLAAVVHYAGHIVDRGADARLLLAPSGGRTSLSAREIGALHLSKTRVVVLAACRGSGTNERHAIVQDMATGFLQAGVPTVIASATDVDDLEAPETMKRLHRFLANGDDAAEALRKTAQADRKAGKAVPLSVRLLVMGGSRALVR